MSDLSGVRRLLTELLRSDAVEFQRVLENLCASRDAGKAPVWLHSPDAQACLSLAKARVYEIHANPDGAGQVLQRNVQPHAKWAKILEAVDRTLVDVAERREHPKAGCFEFASLNMGTQISLDLDDSDIEIMVQPVAKRLRTEPCNSAASTDAPGSAGAGDVVEPRILLIAPDDRSRRQLSTLLHRGPQATLLDGLEAYLRERSQRRQDLSGDLSTPLRFGEAALLANEAQAVAQELEELQPRSALQARKLADGRMCHPRIDIISADDTEGQLEVRLAEMQPHAVLVFEPTLHAIRALEVYCASCKSARQGPVIKKEAGTAGYAEPTRALVPFHVYLLVFDESVEKHRFDQCVVQAHCASPHACPMTTAV